MFLFVYVVSDPTTSGITVLTKQLLKLQQKSLSVVQKPVLSRVRGLVSMETFVRISEKGRSPWRLPHSTVTQNYVCLTRELLNSVESNYDLINFLKQNYYIL